MKKTGIVLSLALAAGVFVFTNDALAMVQVTHKQIGNPENNVVAYLPEIVDMKNVAVQNSINENLKKYLTESLAEYNKHADELYAMEGKNINPSWKPTFKGEYTVHCNNDKIFSVTQFNYSFTGGAHGMSYMHGVTADLQTGQIYKLSDLFIADKDYKQAINKIIEQEIAIRPDKDVISFTGITDEQSFYVEQSGIVVYFSLYEIAPYSSGFLKFHIPFNSLTDYLEFSKLYV